MTVSPFSPKQKTVLTWWHPDSPFCRHDAVICDGAVRSGKTLALSLSFFLWASLSFDRQSFALCGASAGAVKRNVVAPILPYLHSLGFSCRFKESQNTLVLSLAGHANTFFLFGGVHQKSGSAIQGLTLAGALFDEAALLPQAFAEQACARCSVPGSRLFFSCNPQSPEHWFYTEWIQKRAQKNILYLRFTMRDNPSLSPGIRQRYERLYSGAFYQRFVLGQWVAAEGLVYDFFDRDACPPPPDGPFARFVISCDYGTRNPASFGLWGLRDGVWFRIDEFYFDAREKGFSLTDAEYADAVRTLAGERTVEQVVVDPSALSFIVALRQRGWRVAPAKNNVAQGIRTTAELLKSGKIVICRNCTHILREFALYRWDRDDAPRKEDDHAMDDLRYFAATIAAPRPRAGFAAAVAAR